MHETLVVTSIQFLRLISMALCMALLCLGTACRNEDVGADACRLIWQHLGM